MGYRGIIAAAATGVLCGPAAASATQLRFADDFESGLAGWDIAGPHVIRIRASGDPNHGGVLELIPDGWDIYALIRDSDRWGNVRVEGEMMFPDDRHNYLGFLYHFRRVATRTDFGNLYVKGNGSYIRANPHRDGNVGRTLYEEFRTPLVGTAAVRAGEWQRFALEVGETETHLYVGDMETPQVTFPFFEGRTGQVGFQPRSIGWPVWIDNVRVTSINEPRYRGPPRPAITYMPDSLLTSWKVIGPLSEHDPTVERQPDHPSLAWRPFATDARGAVVTGQVTDYDGPDAIAYFRTEITVPRDTIVALHFSSVDDMTMWLNGRFTVGFYHRRDTAWYDFWSNPDHAGRSVPLLLRAGPNHLVVRVRGGTYASGGFFARLEPTRQDIVLPIDGR